ncbi:MAG: C10 family peptidase [Candidatus Cloacimonetes bacterium]|nr:C10 family peptidase [Candidatus Cloacimonadota bacterium]
MKKKGFLFFAVFMLVSILTAIPVSQDDAIQVASNWYLERSNEVGLKNVEIIETFVTQENLQDIYYVYNFKEGGYVMIAADDAITPILGYNFEHHYKLNNHPPQFEAMLESFKEQIVYTKNNNLSASKVTKKAWERLNVKKERFKKNRDFNRLGPLLNSTWDQDYSWNTYCPADASGPGGYVYAGCVATAMAQIMNYWGHPASGTGSHGYTDPTYGYLSANFGSTTYSFPMNNSSATNASRELLYHCGVSVEMEYGYDGSGAFTSDVVSALETYFSYDVSAYYDSKAYHTDSVWENMIRANLNNSRPLQYRGSGTGGHSFNLDGYEDTDISHFHFNWGWSGYYNGYYYLSSLNPGTADFTTNQAAIFDIFPENGVPGTPTNPDPANTATNISIDTMISWTNGANTDNVDVYFGTSLLLVSNKDASVKIFANTTSTSVDPSGAGSLDNDTTYYWRVVCKNSTRAETDGPVWSFTTESAGGIQAELIYHESSYYICSLPDANYNIPAYWQQFTPSGPGELLSLKFNLLPEHHDPHNGVLHLTVYDVPGGTNLGGIDVDTDVLTDGLYEFDMTGINYSFGVSEEFYIQVTFTPDTGSDMLYMYMGEEENGVDIFYDGHSHFEYNGSYNYWWTGGTEQYIDELNLSAVVEYESSPEIHDFMVQTLSFYGFFLPTETRANIDFEADIKNIGTFDESSVEIELVITDTTYSRNVVFSNSQYISLVSGDSTTVTFDTWSVSTTGEYIVKVETKLATDEVLSNNTILVEQQVCSYPTELTYDDGTAESAYAKYSAGNGFANKFTPPYIPYSISDISFHVWNDTWPDPGSNEMKIMVLDDDGTDGSPGTILYEEIVTVVRGAWNTYNLNGSRNILLEDGSFYVASISTADNPNCPGLSVDSSGPFAGQNVAWDFQDGVWTQGYAGYGNEYMIRATVIDGLIDAPVVTIETINSGDNVELTWNPVPYANSYDVYSSLEPNGTFTIEPTGTAISGTSWSESTSEKKFYYIIASSDTPSRNSNQYKKLVNTRLKSTVKEFNNASKSVGIPNKISIIKKVK